MPARTVAAREGTVTEALLQAVERIRPIIEEHAETAEANRQLSEVVYDAMYRAGLFAMLAPKAHGGLELRPVEAMQVWEAIARIDSAAAWNLVMNQAISAFAAWLPAEGVRELFLGQDRSSRERAYGLTVTHMQGLQLPAT